MSKEHEELRAIRSSVSTLKGLLAILALALVGMAYAFSRHHHIGSLLSDFITAIGVSIAAIFFFAFLWGLFNSWRTQKRTEKIP